MDPRNPALRRHHAQATALRPPRAVPGCATCPLADALSRSLQSPLPWNDWQKAYYKLKPFWPHAIPLTHTEFQALMTSRFGISNASGPLPPAILQRVQAMPQRTQALADLLQHKLHQVLSNTLASWRTTICPLTHALSRSLQSPIHWNDWQQAYSKLKPFWPAALPLSHPRFQALMTGRFGIHWNHNAASSPLPQEALADMTSCNMSKLFLNVFDALPSPALRQEPYFGALLQTFGAIFVVFISRSTPCNLRARHA